MTNSRNKSWRLEMSKSQGGGSRRRTRLRNNRNQLTPSASRNPVEVAFGRARRAVQRRASTSSS